MMRGVWFLSYEQFSRIRPGPDAVAISISDRFYEARVAPGFAAVLRQRFSDADPALEALPPGAQLFTPDHAGELNVWCDHWLGRDGITHLYVQCWAGRTRSAANAWWISQQYRIPLRTDFPLQFMNLHILRQLPGAHPLPALTSGERDCRAARSPGEHFAPLRFLASGQTREKGDP